LTVPALVAEAAGRNVASVTAAMAAMNRRANLGVNMIEISSGIQTVENGFRLDQIAIGGL
jgi:hypothetical protein